MSHKDIIESIRRVGENNLRPGNHLVLYGSRARGDANADSDWDVLVLLNKPSIEQEDYDGICYQLTNLGWNLGEMIIPVMYTMKEWEQSSYTPFYKNVEQDGIVLV